MGDEQKAALAEAESFCSVFSDMLGCLPLKPLVTLFCKEHCSVRGNQGGG